VRIVDPISDAIVVVLGKYAIDKGAEIAPRVGRHAVETAERLFKLVMDRLSSKGGEGEVIASGFEREPDVFAKPFARVLDHEIESDPVFAAQVYKLVDGYNQAVDAHSGADEYKISIKGPVSGVGFVVGSGTVSAGGDIVGGKA
jgi:hypothetical protein